MSLDTRLLLFKAVATIKKACLFHMSSKTGSYMKYRQALFIILFVSLNYYSELDAFNYIHLLIINVCFS